MAGIDGRRLESYALRAHRKRSGRSKSLPKTAAACCCRQRSAARCNRGIRRRAKNGPGEPSNPPALYRLLVPLHRGIDGLIVTGTEGR